MKRKRGWFKEARKKFVSKRIFSWTLSHYRNNFSHQIEVLNDGSTTLKYNDKSERYQVINAIRGLGFANGFWKAREYAKKHDDDWCLTFDKVIKI